VCTLIAGIDVLGPGTLVVGANRDESPERATAGPGVLVARPRVVGGRDLVSGGTWLAIREGRFVSALMNRRPLPDAALDPSALRSRGLLCLDAAAGGPALDEPATIDPGTGELRPRRLDAALALIARDAYAHCTLVGLTTDGIGWAIHAGAGQGRAPEATWIGAGWHVITHQEVDDPTEPRTAWLLRRLEGANPRDADEALALLGSLLRLHGDGGEPPVCLHRERFPTVSSSLLALRGAAEGAAPVSIGPPRYLHAAGPPCVTPYEDVSKLLAP
jgi:hypothetical protein